MAHGTGLQDRAPEASQEGLDQVRHIQSGAPAPRRPLGGHMSTNTVPTPKGRKVTMVILAVAIVGILIFVLAYPFLWGASSSQASDTPTPGASATAEATPSPTGVCEPQFTQVAANNDNNRVIGNFGERYAAATANANNLSDAQRALLLEESGKDATVLAAWAQAFGLYGDPSKWPELVNNGCLSSEGIKLHNQFEGALTAEGVTFEEAQAPENGFNSGVFDGVYGTSETQGVTGDRKAIKVTLKDGSVVYLLVRCGNPVYPGKPDLPNVPTDNPPPDNPPPPVNPPEQPGKNPAEDPWPQGNAPVGGGPNKDPGPGVYIPPTQIERPPDTPRVNPAPPAPQPPAPQPGPNPAPVPTKDPAPPPPPEPTAPKPSAPETGCDASAPGATC